MLQPNPNINYAFVSLMYAFGSVLYIALYGFEQWSGEAFSVQKHSEGAAYGSSSSITRNGDESSVTSPGVLKELHTSLQGIYLIFSPFIPYLMWSLILWQKARNGGKNSNAQEEQKQKGD
jgi:hypothetical protein